MSLVYEVLFGEDISSACAKAADLMEKRGEPVEMTFNSISLTIGPGETAQQMREAYWTEYQRRFRAYQASDEGVMAENQRQARLTHSQNVMDEALVELETLDFTDYLAVINWLRKIREPSNHSGVIFQAADVARNFYHHGYMPNENSGRDYNGEDMENSARFLVGQAIVSLLHGGGIHQVFDHQSDLWLAKFHN